MDGRDPVPAVHGLLEEGDVLELLDQPLVDGGALVGLLRGRRHLGEDGAHPGGGAEAVPVPVDHDGLFLLEEAGAADPPDSVVPVLLEPALLGLLDELGVVLLPGSVGDELPLWLGLDDGLFEALQGGGDFFVGRVRVDPGQHVEQLGLEGSPFSFSTLGGGGEHLTDVRSALSGILNLGDNGTPHLGVSSIVGVGDGLVLGARGVRTFARSKPLAGVVIVGIDIHRTRQVVVTASLGNGLRGCLLVDDGARFVGSFGRLGLSLNLLCIFISALSLSAASQLDPNRLLLVLLGGLGTLLGLALGASGRGLHWALVLVTSGASAAGGHLLGDEVSQDLDELVSGGGGFELDAHLVVDAELSWGQGQDGLRLGAVDELEVVARTRFGGGHSAAGSDKLDEDATEVRKLDLAIAALGSSLAEQVVQGLEKVGTRASHDESMRGVACLCGEVVR